MKLNKVESVLLVIVFAIVRFILMGYGWYQLVYETVYPVCEGIFQVVGMFMSTYYTIKRCIVDIRNIIKG